MHAACLGAGFRSLHFFSRMINHFCVSFVVMVSSFRGSRASDFAMGEMGSRQAVRGACRRPIIARKLHDKPCRDGALCGNLPDGVFRTCWSATCASPPRATVRCGICSVTHSSPPVSTSITCWGRPNSRVTSRQIGERHFSSQCRAPKARCGAPPAGAASPGKASCPWRGRDG
jgi:hypothetical protein